MVNQSIRFGKNTLHNIHRGIRRAAFNVPVRILRLDCRCELCLGQLSGTCRFLCRSCYQDLPQSSHVCSHCSEPMQHTAEQATKQRCQRCQHTPPLYDYSQCRFPYQPPINLWIRLAKDKHQEHWMKRLAEVMSMQPPSSLAHVDGLVFIPSHWLKRLKRGYNPSEHLARYLSRHIDIPIIDQALVKHHAYDQRGLNAESRRRNLSHSLLPGQLDLTGKHLLIIDDVMTTGATADAAARCLKQQGAAIVGVWALARTPPAMRTGA